MKIRIAWIAMLLFLVPPATAQWAWAETTQSPEVVVRGTGEVLVMPDRAEIHFAIESRGDEPGTAAADAATRQQRALEALRAAGVPDDAITTASYSVMPEWEYEEQRKRILKGYRAYSVLRMRTGMLDRVGEWIDIALSAGINHVQSVNFDVSELDAARRQAMNAAVVQARMYAETMAEAAGGRLGRLILISLEEPARPLGVTLERMQYADVQAAGTQITPGEQVVSATVLTRWHFEQE